MCVLCTCCREVHRDVYFFLIYHLSGMLRPPETCMVEEFHLNMLSFQTVTLCLSVALCPSLTNTYVTICHLYPCRGI